MEPPLTLVSTSHEEKFTMNTTTKPNATLVVLRRQLSRLQESYEACDLNLNNKWLSEHEKQHRIDRLNYLESQMDSIYKQIKEIEKPLTAMLA